MNSKYQKKHAQTKVIQAKPSWGRNLLRVLVAMLGHFLSWKIFDRLLRSRILNPNAVGKHHWLVRIWYFVMHHWTVSIALHVRCEALDRVAPTRLTYFCATHNPIFETIQ